MNKKLLILLVFPLLTLFYSCNPQKRLARKKHAYMESAYSNLKKTVNEAEVTILNDTVKVLFPEHLLFQRNSSEINKETYPLMRRFSDALNIYTKTKILINGYTDNTGSETVNKRLSADRADSAGSVLKQSGVIKDRLEYWGHGMSNPIADNTSEEGRRRNRRVEFIILYNIEAAGN